MRHRSDLIRSRQSVFWYRDQIQTDQPVHDATFVSYYSHMLIEDITNHIMPIGGRTERTSFRVVTIPENRHSDDLIAHALDDRDFGGGRLAPALCQFVATCAQTILTFGAAVYEIVYLSDPDTAEVVGFELEFVPSGSVQRHGSRLIQEIPAEIAEQRQIAGSIELPAENMVTVVLPDPLGQILKNTMSSLVHLSDLMHPDFLIPDENVHRRVPVDSSELFRSQNIAVAAACKDIGWNARSLLDEEALEYYTLYRHLRFEKFVIEFRGAILDSINEALERVGRVLPQVSQVKVEGLLTAEDVEIAVDRLNTGKGTFKEIMQPFMVL